MRLRSLLSRRHLILSATALALLGFGFFLGKWRNRRDSVGKYPEELVYATSSDNIVNGGAFFIPPKESTKPVAVIWVHGWGVNFYSPTYVRIGRALADRGYPCVAVNTRMHDIGTVAGYRNGKRLRGGGYWGVPSEAVRDIAAWIDFAGERGFDKVILVGHSFGWSVVRAYQGETQDRRVVGVVLASGGVKANTPPADTKQQANRESQLAEATRLVAAGRGDDLLRLPNRPFPSFISAATFLDDAKTPAEYADFFGEKTPNPAVTRVRCPLLAFFGTRESEIGTEADLELIKTCIQRLPSGPRSVTTVMIRRADHMYAGEEERVARTIATWADNQVLTGRPTEGENRAREGRQTKE
jgi:pimeloyl-ACP methyl ester carboxylesterase